MILFYLLIVVIGAVLLFGVAFIWGLLHLRASIRKANEEADKVPLSAVPLLAEECVRGFKEKFDSDLIYDEYDATAKILSDRMDQFESIKSGFAKEDFYWYGVLPLGAYAGELIRRKTGGRWEADEEGVPILKVPVKGEAEDAITYPFHKIIKHATMGDDGDLYAFFLSALHLDRAAQSIKASASPTQD